MDDPDQVPTWAMDQLRQAVGCAIADGGALPAGSAQQYQYIPPWMVGVDPAIQTLPALTTPLAHAVFRCLLRLATVVAYGADGKGDAAGAVWALGTRACGAMVEVAAPTGQGLFFAYLELAAMKCVALDVLLATTPSDGSLSAAEQARLQGLAAPHVRWIVDDIVTLKCPRCKAAFVDFTGCCSLYCPCGCSFCAHWCVAEPLGVVPTWVCLETFMSGQCCGPVAKLVCPSYDVAAWRTVAPMPTHMY
jgi:hypothetical protein